MVWWRFWGSLVLWNVPTINYFLRRNSRSLDSKASSRTPCHAKVHICNVIPHWWSVFALGQVLGLIHRYTNLFPHTFTYNSTNYYLRVIRTKKYPYFTTTQLVSLAWLISWDSYERINCITIFKKCIFAYELRLKSALRFVSGVYGTIEPASTRTYSWLWWSRCWSAWRCT